MTHFTGEDRRRIIIISIIIIIIIIFIISSSSSSMNIIIYCWLIAQSTVQGHLRAFIRWLHLEQNLVTKGTKRVQYVA